MKDLYIIGGCNGAGKTTASFSILPDILDCREFVNADEIARGLSPFRSEAVAFEAGRIMLKRIKDLIRAGETFAFETTLSTRSYKNLITDASKSGYKVTLIYFWLEHVQLAIDRVRNRVRDGGHDIPEEIIRRRYRSGIKNLFEIYLPTVDRALLFDNSSNNPLVLAEKTRNDEIQILDKIKYYILKSIYDEANK